MNKKIFLMSALLFLFSMAAIGAVTYFYIQQEIKTPLDGGTISNKDFTIEKGEGVKQISADLEREELIKGAGYFQLYVWQTKLASRIQAGTYTLSNSMSIPEIVEILTGGKIKSNQVRVRFTEGFLLKDIDRELSRSGLISEGDFIKFDSQSGFDASAFDFLSDKPEKAGLEGFYFPDTYNFTSGSSVRDIAKKMLDNFGKKLTPDLKADIKKQGKTIFETLILASIIEKEAGSKEDMGKISSVFHNRLSSNMRLESDATVNYVIGKGRSQATYEDLAVDSPFNTYMYSGLPPAPIANPGIDAIRAAVYPEKTDYYYFLSKKDTGEAVFSKTYEEHLMNKSRYLK